MKRLHRDNIFQWWLFSCGLLVGTIFLFSSLATVLADSQVDDNDNKGGPPQERSVAMSQAPAGSNRAADDPTLIDRYCVSCHNSRLRAGNLVLEGMDPARAYEAPETWEKVLRKLRAGMMPPAGRRHPDEAAVVRFVSGVATAIDAAAKAEPNPGRTDPMRRLNRTEYKNAIRDLLDLDVDTRELLPADDSSGGFDNLSLGGLDPGRLERYISAARKVSKIAVGAPIRTPITDYVYVTPELNQDRYVEGLPFGTRGGVSFDYYFPLDAEYEIQARLGRDIVAGGIVAGLFSGESHELVMLIDGDVIAEHKIALPKRTAPSDADQQDNNDPFAQFSLTDQEWDNFLRARTAVKAGMHEVVVTFVSHGDRLVEMHRRPYEKRHLTFGEDQRQQPTLHSVGITGPLQPSGPGETASRQRIFSCQPGQSLSETACAEQILTRLGRLAFRRTLSEGDVARLMAPYKEGRAEGNFEDGIERALRYILASPEFVFRVEGAPAGKAAEGIYELDDLALASRLSFFLWSSIPDDELIDLAARKELSKPAVLEGQVRRMLADARASALVSGFASQWLYLRNLSEMTRDAAAFPDFDEGLRQAFRRETELFVESIMREDRSVLDLFRANYTFLNERLAKHYGIPDVYGNHFRRVALPANSPRAGILGQGSVLSVTSYATRTSPVIRGKWVLSNILGVPPPDPPPNVPPLSENKVDQELSMRERMASHRSNPVCAGCHQMMDPIGLAMENFDGLGAWRSHTDAFAPLDVSGSMPDGEKFDGISGLRTALLERSDLIVDTLVAKLLSYAVGRPIEYYDAPAVREIVQSAKDDDYRFSSLVLGIVRSVPFEMRKVSPEETGLASQEIASR